MYFKGVICEFSSRFPYKPAVSLGLRGYGLRFRFHGRPPADMSLQGTHRSPISFSHRFAEFLPSAYSPDKRPDWDSGDIKYLLHNKRAWLV